MQIVISGAGEVGSYLAGKLASENHNIVLIDSDPARCRSLGGQYDLQTVSGNGSSPQVLDEANIKSADMFIAVTNHDEVNIVGSMVASRNGVPKIITRVSNEDYFSAHSSLHQETLGIDLVVNRVRSLTPKASCLLIGPSDRPVKLPPPSGQEEWPEDVPRQFHARARQPQVIDAQRRVAHRYGCGYWDMAAAMGGPLSMVQWAHSTPQLAARDYVHLTRAGYERMADMFHHALMAGYRAR